MRPYFNIPQELKNDKAWVNVWNSSKIPMQTAVKKAASASNPETWGTFDEAAENVAAGRYDGLGYVFHDNGIIGIDIDDGFSEGFLNAMAAEIVMNCKSYTEKSRSGRGIHILLRGTLPFAGKNNGKGVEIYKTGRYFIMTGKVLVFREILENQAAIDYVVQNYFPETMKESNSKSTYATYQPVYSKPEHGRIVLHPHYPAVKPGSRNQSLTSLAGQLHAAGYDAQYIYRILLYVNSESCTPPLPQSEVKTIVRSISRYRR